MVIDYNFPGFMEKYFSFLTTFLDKLKRNENFRKFTYHSAKLGGLLCHYSDVVKDTVLFITIYNINGGVNPIFEYPTKFTSVVIVFSGFSIFIPLLMSSIHLVKNNYHMIYIGCKLSRTKQFFMKIGIILFSVLNPVILLHSYENVKEKARLEAKHLNSIRLPRTVKSLTIIKNQLVEYKDIDLKLGMPSIKKQAHSA